MIGIVKKGDTYADDIKQARNLVKFKKLILVFPTVVLAVLAIALAIVLKNVGLLLIAVVAVAYVVVMLATLPALYKKLCGSIAQKYMEYYKTPEAQRQALLSCASGCNEVDHYRENTLVCAWQNGNLLKLTFENATMMDSLIPLCNIGLERHSDIDKKSA